MSSFVLTRLAAEDIDEIRRFIANDRGPDTARRIVGELREAIRRLARQPGLGHQREDLSDDPDIRFWSLHSFLIVYYPAPRPLRVVRILHEARDVGHILSEDKGSD